MDFVDRHIQELKDQVREARKKYDPLVRRLTDTEFIAIYEAVMDERVRRMQELILTNPFVRQAAVNRLKEELQAQEDEKN